MVKPTMINTLEVFGAFRLKRFLRRWQPLILMYHRIVDHPLIPGVPPSAFEEHLMYLKRHFRVVPMKQLATEIREQRTKPYSVALTFDDGHSDFYENAWPALKRFELPASVYVTTGFIDRKEWLWPDRLRYLLMNSRVTEFQVHGTAPLSLKKNSLKKVWGILGDHCLSMKPEVRERFLRCVETELEVALPEEPEAPFSPLTWAQLRDMKKGGIEVGSHSVTHPILSQLTEKQLEQELRLSHDRIKTEVGTAPTGICYPNGMAVDTSPRVEKKAAQWYDYGLVAYPATLRCDRVMHLGRWAAPSDSRRLRQILSGMTRNDNQNGEYR